MPAPALKSMAAKHGVSTDRAEHLWDKAKDIASKEYKYGKKSPNHWAIVMGIGKKMMGDKKKKNESFTFKDFVSALNEAEQTATTKKNDDELPTTLKKQAGPLLSPLDKLKNKVKVAAGVKPMFLKKQAESVDA